MRTEHLEIWGPLTVLRYMYLRNHKGISQEKAVNFIDASFP